MPQARVVDSISNAVTEAEATCGFIRQFIHVLEIPSGLGDGYTDEEIKTTENRIGRQLPPLFALFISLLAAEEILLPARISLFHQPS